MRSLYGIKKVINIVVRLVVYVIISYYHCLKYCFPYLPATFGLIPIELFDDIKDDKCCSDICIVCIFYFGVESFEVYIQTKGEYNTINN